MAAQHLFLGNVDKNGRNVIVPLGVPGWYHVTNLVAGAPGFPATNTPCSVALTPAGLPGGDMLGPGDSLDINAGSTGIWIGGPVEGNVAVVSVEYRPYPTYRVISPMGEYSTSTTCKAFGVGVKLTPGHWSPIATNIQCMHKLRIRVIGNGPAWIGSHLNPGTPPDYAGPPPHEQDIAHVGGAFPFYEHDGIQELEGNPTIFAYCYPRTDGVEPNVVVHALKMARGRTFQQPVL